MYIQLQGLALGRHDNIVTALKIDRDRLLGSRLRLDPNRQIKNSASPHLLFYCLCLFFGL